MDIIKTVLVALLSLLLVGCLSSKTYVDPNFSTATYDDVNPVVEKYQSLISIEFQRNGKPLPSVNPEVRGHVERTLRATGVIAPSVKETNISIKVIVNNVADLVGASTKGFGTGLTFGAAGSLVTDYYVISITFDDGNGTTVTENYQHALHTTIGNKSAPFNNIQSTTPSAGFGTIVEQALLNFIKDMQTKGLLSLDTNWLLKYA